ncbi:hypothetical protein [Sporolituus thermophilus]|uniref:Glycosyl transferase family 2 n=1 Tax=Sporolituus thermophilus DSM 23256 TaxID=1123285 RepID=A0A1G7P1D0_9FIRM|nr:hypothetical protein [Sporolituus thermophilus]SDF79230.1 hypothetical protein SAMN05660235_02768 [Sporolituus thermophilus DSM 23256]
MFFSYTASVVLLSLALYGLWCFLKDLWDWYLAPKVFRPPSVTFLVLVKNAEQEIEDLLRYLIRELESADTDVDAVVVDCGSTDLTLPIVERLAAATETVTVLPLPASARPVAEALPLCRGKVVHVLDLTSRLRGQDFLVSVCALLRSDCRTVIVPKSRAGD